MRFDLVTLRLFLAIADEKNIAHAAAREHIAASAVSKRILDLEYELRAPLFRRHQRGVDLTPAGETLQRHTRSLLSILDRMRGELSEYSAGLRGHVQVSANTSAIIEFLPEELRGFITEYPDIRIELQERASSNTVRLVQDGVVDVGIIAGSVSTGDLEVMPYHVDRLVMIVPADHPIASRRSIRFEETLRYDHVGLNPDTSLHLLLTEFAARTKQRINFKVCVTSFDALRRLIQTRIGIGVLPEACVKPYESVMKLRGIPLSDPWALRSLNICVREFGTLPVPARLLVNHLRNRQHVLPVLDAGINEGSNPEYARHRKLYNHAAGKEGHQASRTRPPGAAPGMVAAERAATTSLSRSTPVANP